MVATVGAAGQIEKSCGSLQQAFPEQEQGSTGDLSLKSLALITSISFL